MSEVAVPPLMVTNPRSIDADVSIVKTFVDGEPKYRGNVWPALKKNILIGTPIGMFASVNEKGGGPGNEAVSVCARTALVVALRTLITVPETVPVNVIDPPAAGVDGDVPPPELPLHATRQTMSTERQA